MPPSTAAQTLLSPAELSYLHSSLSLTPPIRSDSRSPTQFRPLIAEPDILPSTNGSARICFADGTEAIVGVKAEVEKSRPTPPTDGGRQTDGQDEDMGEAEEEEEGRGRGRGRGESAWVELTIEIPGCRDDDALSVFLAAMLTEALLATGELPDKLYLNNRFHWHLYIDILLLSPPLSYPLPLLSLTTHLALRCTRLPALVSDADEDPLFDDDWAAAVLLYPPISSTSQDRPPVTLLVMVVAANVIFDPSREELAVADAVLAVSITGAPGGGARVVGVRMVDPPSRGMAAGVPDGLDLATGERAGEVERGVWRGPRGGVKRGLVGRVVKMVVERGGLGEEVLGGLEGVDVG